MEGGLCIQDTIASRYIYEFLIITYLRYLGMYLPYSVRGGFFV